MDPIKESGPVASASSRSDRPPTYRLVIRAEIIPERAPLPPARHSSNKRALLLVAVAIAVLALSWAGLKALRTDPEAHSPALPPDTSEAAPIVSTEPLPKPADPARSTASTSIQSESVKANSAQLSDQGGQDAPPSPVDEVIPNVPQSALQTIQGTVRVSVRVAVDMQGKVVAAIPVDPGPSRYFARLSTEAAKKWTFSPTHAAGQRTMLLRFDFTREGATARAGS